jgi:hypothetical protein
MDSLCNVQEVPVETPREYYSLFKDLPRLASEVGVKEAAKQLAAATRNQVDREAIVAWVEKVRRKRRIWREDARGAFRILQTFYWDNFIRKRPIFGRIARFLAAQANLKYPKPTLETDDEVYIESPWGINCPIVRGFDGDLERCRPLCDACFAEKVIIEPDQWMLLEIAAPTLEIQLSKFREKPDQNCEYVLVSE